VHDYLVCTPGFAWGTLGGPELVPVNAR